MSKARHSGYLAVLGGNALACPAIVRLRELGYRVLVIDGNPAAPAGKLADLFMHQDFSDVPATRKRLSSIDLIGVMPLNDFAVGAAAIARERGLPGWSEFSERCLRNKIEMKKAWMEAGLPTAPATFATVTDLISGKFPGWDTWPCVVKPSFSGGGSRGVFVANDWGEVVRGLAATQTRYLDGGVVIEAFVAGSEHTMEVVIRRGEPRLLSISDKQNYPGSHTVVQNLYFPGPVGNAHRAVLEPLAYAACTALKLTDGAAHFEVLLADGQGCLLEVGGRPGGGINLHPICELSTGYDYPAILAAILTGGEPVFDRKPTCHLAWHYFPAGRGVVNSIEGFDEARADPHVVHSEVYETVGRARLDLRDDLARPGYFLVRGNSHEEARSRASELVGRVRFHTTCRTEHTA